MVLSPETGVLPREAPEVTASEEAVARRRRLSGHLALLAANLVFGLFPVYGRMAMDPERGVTPFALATWRIGCGAAIFTVLALVASRGPRLPRRADVGAIALLAMLGIVANQALYLTGLERSNAANAGLMMCTIPVFTFVVAALSRQERFSPVRSLGVAITLLGVLPLLLDDDVSLGGRRAVGNLLIAANCLCYSVYLVAMKPFRGRYSALAIMAWVYVLSLPAIPFLAAGEPLLPAVSDAASWGSLAYVVLGPTVIAYLLNAFALGRVRASTTAFYIFMQPVIAAVGGGWILGEPIGAEVLLASACLVPGMLLVTRKDK
ncbi:MAG: DMT family transporter [Planctomycetota bacterium]|nr:DMT family transporter [Planctomycetota bacterium]